ncbi:MAG TPA: sulfatase-like hydrolase/transferase [Kofleriaceae bacterium]|nr:sulfatase-like hydrolase/transferase [Kofleriaceae bacterium]
MLSVARWLAPSAAAACAGAVVAGAIEGAGMDDVFGAIAAGGFLALVAAPMLLVACALARGLWAAWQPAELGLIEDGGGAPRLAGWLGTLVLGAVVLAWAMWQGTWLLAGATAFKPLSLSFAEPILAVVVGLAIVVASRPVARALAALARWLDARWRRRGHRSLISPRRQLIALAAVTLGGLYALWRFAIAPRLGPIDTSPLLVPAAGLVVAAIAQAGWSRGARARRFASAACAAIVIAAVACALYAWRARPGLTLSVWGDRPLAGLAIDWLFDLDAIRDRLPAAAMAPTPRAGAAHPDILLLTIDAVRADHTPPYGGTADMPILRALGTRGAVFDWAFSPSNVTRRSIPSMVIGLAPTRIKGRVVGWALRLDPRYVLLAERLRAGGYDTAGFMCCDGIWGRDMRTGLSRGLDHLETEPRENGAVLARMARTWLDARERTSPHRPLFLWMHFIEPHNWQAASGEPHTDDERRRFYDRALAASDAMLGEVIGAFANRPGDRMPIVIISADHGEGLGDHGQPFHSTDLYDSQIHVPLVIAGPGIKPGHIPETVSLTDLTPTVLDLAGFVPPTGIDIDGRSIADLATGARAPDPDGGIAFAAMIKDRSNPGGLRAVVLGPWKLIDNGSSLELYNVHADPGERANLISPRAPMLEALKRMLSAWRERSKVSPF